MHSLSFKLFTVQGTDDVNINDSLQDNNEMDQGVPKETDVGITEYVNDLPGFNGVIKQR